MENPAELNYVLGGFFALSSAAFYAVAAIYFRRLGDSVSPLAINLGKGIIGLLCIGVLLMFTGFGEIVWKSVLLLGLSGLIGISLGDTAYFIALVRLGPRRTLLLTTLMPVLAAFLAMVFLGERLSPKGWLGAALTLGGVAWVMWERLPEKADTEMQRSGIAWGLLTVVCGAVGIILAKIGLADTKPMDATFIRLLFGTAGLVIFGIGKGSLRNWFAPLKAPRLLGVLFVASFLGTFLGIWFSLIALAYTSATVATILNSTSPIFILPLAVLFMKERISARAVTGAIIAVAGVSLLFIG